MPSLPGRGHPLLVLALAAVALLAAAPPASADPTVADLDRQISAAAQRLETVVEHHNAVRADLQATRARSAATEARLGQATVAVRASQHRVDEIASWAFKLGPAGSPLSTLTSSSPATFLARLTVLEGTALSNAAEIARLDQLSRQLRQDHGVLDRLVTDQARQESDLAAVKATVELDLARLRGLRQLIGTTSRKVTRTVTAPPAPPPPVSGAAGTAVRFAYAQLGKYYEFGAAGPRTFDCSGLVLAAWRAAGVNLPHNAARQFRVVSHVRRDELRPGDLVFYYADLHHVALYVGDGTVIHAPNDGEQLRLDRVNLAPVRGYGRPR